MEETMINSGLLNPHSWVFGLLFRPQRSGIPTAAATNQQNPMYRIAWRCLSRTLCWEYSNGCMTALYLWKNKMQNWFCRPILGDINSYWSKKIIYILLFCLPINTYSNQVEDTWGRTNNINCDVNVTENPWHCPIWRYLKWIFIYIIFELLN